MSSGGKGPRRPGKGSASKLDESLRPKGKSFKPPLRSSSRRGEKMDSKLYAALVELGNKQPTINMHGGVGIPGGRKTADVQKFKLLDFSEIGPQLDKILQTSKNVRQRRDEKTAGIEDFRSEVAAVNRRIEFEEGQIGLHSLHVGNDIAAVWNSAKDKSRVYDYPELASRLDERLANPNRNGKDYGTSGEALDTRRAHVAQGMQHFIAGNQEEAVKSFDAAGLNARGRKWAFKMTAVLLAEKGREAHGGRGGDRVQGALDHVIGGGATAGKSFKDVFVTHADTLAPFAQRGGAKTFNK
jgi:hypothetical protein